MTFNGIISEDKIENMATLIFNSMCNDDETADTSEIMAIEEDLRYIVDNISNRRMQRQWKSEFTEYIKEFN